MNLRKMDHDEFMKYGDSNPKGRADPDWNAERKRRYKNASKRCSQSQPDGWHADLRPKTIEKE